MIVHKVLPEIGSVELIRSSRVKNINISIRPFSSVKVSVPRNVSFDEAISVVENKKAWILRHRKRIAEIESQRTVFNLTTIFTTREHFISLQIEETQRTLIKENQKSVKVIFPKGSDINSEFVQQTMNSVVNEVFRREAKKYLPNKVNDLSRKFDIPFRKLFIKNIRTRWGSCSVQNNINLSIHLMRLPEELIDYVVLHELCHVLVKNHSPIFWKKLDEICPNAKKKDKMLQKYKLSIY
ncbi:MAG: M48 family metallopeptidase [Bacteroidetes bacterium]|nr:M48 family metallopeptidase [Bacteroidota bacterium]MBU1679167.1 M48 family metallopeptidase [Bacteroidota bacterium]MBU1932017.1 M48 family metallopeptidase [Patescibacteria group bacterium]MBU2508643.1 M48 family metallopeptidase [Bacteroidota bacterium]